MDTSHFVAALVGAWLAAPLGLFVGVWLAKGAGEYARGRASAYEAMARGQRNGRTTSDGQSPSEGGVGGSEITDLAEYAESHGRWRQA